MMMLLFPVLIVLMRSQIGQTSTVMYLSLSLIPFFFSQERVADAKRAPPPLLVSLGGRAR